MDGKIGEGVDKMGELLKKYVGAQHQLQDQIKQVKESVGHVEMICKAKVNKEHQQFRTYAATFTRETDQAPVQPKQIKRVASAVGLKDKKYSTQSEQIASKTTKN